jgi:2-polyprenyl-3-methyl-5-hydroxy-6-metoxy-1,4-benzoquinol methylase
VSENGAIMRDWRRWWRTTPNPTPGVDPCVQVGRTVGGRGLPEAEVALLVTELRRLGQPAASHRALDLCCGNGMLTRRVWRECARVTGVDISEPLLQVACRSHAGDPGLTFVREDLSTCAFAGLPGAPFDRISMVESLQYFHPEDALAWMAGLMTSLSDTFRMVCSGIPDADQFEAFADTPERREAMLHLRATAGDPFGYWWTIPEAQELASRLGLQSSISRPHPSLSIAHYRFDLVLHT